MGSKRRIVGVTSQGSGAGEWSDKPGIRAGSAGNQTGTGSRNRIQGPGETHTKAESAGLNVP
ncbi:unnamed protein product [Staurois parvus]|uniref:Uncharacterized protein n=1 Tax=Staurois parvus TaxID=386267 RepID=A0ABN9EH01_9NEOB|nr:unnamed protein product [Staurois parvus]